MFTLVDRLRRVGATRIARFLRAHLVGTPAASPFLTEQFRARSRGGTKTRVWNF